MTFLQSAKYVGYGFFGIVLFGIVVNKVFAGEGGNITGFCYLTDNKDSLFCGPTNKPEDLDTFCLAVEVSEDQGSLYICTNDLEAFRKGYQMLHNGETKGMGYHHEGRPKKVPQGLSYTF